MVASCLKLSKSLSQWPKGVWNEGIDPKVSIVKGHSPSPLLSSLRLLIKDR